MRLFGAAVFVLVAEVANVGARAARLAADVLSEASHGAAALAVDVLEAAGEVTDG